MGGSSSANTRQTAAASEAAALDARLTAVNEQLTLANTEKAAAVADVAKARADLLAAQGKSEGARRQAGSVRPTLGEQERNQIERIVQREQTDSNPSTVVGACLVRLHSTKLSGWGRSQHYTCRRGTRNCALL